VVMTTTKETEMKLMEVRYDNQPYGVCSSCECDDNKLVQVRFPKTNAGLYLCKSCTQKLMFEFDLLPFPQYAD
jgi:predicted SprT family Zn-dependent metalloprotease